MGTFGDVRERSGFVVPWKAAIWTSRVSSTGFALRCSLVAVAFLLCGCDLNIGDSTDMCMGAEPPAGPQCDGDALENVEYACTGPDYDSKLTRTVRFVQDCSALGMKCVAETSGAAVCSGGPCIVDGDCPTGQGCGADHACAPLPSCGPPLTRCEFVCVDEQSDTRNCGACGAKCGGMELCPGAVCSSPFEARQIAVGPSNTCVLLSTGGVVCWAASAAQGEAERSGAIPTLTDTSPPIAVTGIEKASQVAVGASFSCALEAGGAVNCWVWGSAGPAAGLFTSMTVEGTTAIAVGAAHACALLSDGSVSCWGNNDSGQLGVNGTTLSQVPLAVPDVAGAIAIAAGRSHTCALLAGGTIMCWGSDVYGELGDGKTATTSGPVVALGIHGATAVATGDSYTCALLSDATVACWGSKGWDAGTGKVASSRTPAPPLFADGTQLTGVTSLAAGSTYACAQFAGGGVACWGQGGDFYTATAVQNVSGLPGVAAVAAGGAEACAITSGSIECWEASAAPVVVW
jgi:hypothetical protein